MTVRTPPTFLQAGAHTAENTRLALQGFWGSATGSFAGGVSAVDAAHGVVRAGSTQLLVTENGTPNMSVNVNTGSCWIRGTESASQGCYFFHNDGVVNLSISAADATNARRDLIVAQVRDSGYSGSDDDARLFVVAGTPSGSPADPVVPENCLVLARVAVAAGASSIVTANITDLRVYTRPWNTAWGVLDFASVTSSQTFSTNAYVNATGLEVSNTFLVGRRYRLRAYVPAIQQTSTGFVALLAIWEGSNTFRLQTATRDIRNANDEFAFVLSYDFVHSGSDLFNTHRLRGACNLGSKAWKTNVSAQAPAQFVVEDLGPA